MKILIAGGGIGGLCAALCCTHFGHDVIVLEQAPELGDVGAGIQIPPNAMKIFRALGIADRISERAFSPEAIEARMGETGREIFHIPLQDYAQQRWGAPYLHNHRADYIDALRSALAARVPSALRLGAHVRSYQNLPDGIEVTLGNGETLCADLLIGADGIKSVVREQMHGGDRPVFTGNVAWRAVVPTEKLGVAAPPPTACVWMGRGQHAVTYRLRGGALTNFVGVVERGGWQKEGWQKEGWHETGSKEEALADFAGWHRVISSIIEAVPSDTLSRWALFDRTPLPIWCDGAAVLLGDAAHPMLPFLAQGAAMAAEDAWVLAREISKPGQQLVVSLATYQKLRSGRTRRAQAGSRANMRIFHQRSKLGQCITYAPMWLAGRIVPKAVHQRMDWLYGFDATQ